jgi:hypothetical protein
MSHEQHGESLEFVVVSLGISKPNQANILKFLPVLLLFDLRFKTSAISSHG